VTRPEPESRTIEAGAVGYRTKAFEGRRLVTFFLIAFGYSWFLWGLFVFDVLKMPAGVGTQDVEASPMLLLVAITPFGPTIAGFVVTAMTEGRAGVRRLWGRVWRDQRIGWLLVALTFYPALKFIANLVARTLDGQAYPVLAHASVWMFIPPLIANTLISGGMSEEFGWRGYVLPRFQAKWNALISSVVLGVIWASWHIPLFFIPEDEHSQVFFWGWAPRIVALSVLITWVFNNANGSVLAAMLFHGAANASGDLFWCCGSSSWHYYGVELLAAVLIVVIFGPRTLVRRRPGAGRDEGSGIAFSGLPPAASRRALP
jgi:membrane protease YdiL (CAAX protease family)